MEKIELLLLLNKYLIRFEGLNILSEDWEFKDLIKIVTEWRDNLWNHEIGETK